MGEYCSPLIERVGGSPPTARSKFSNRDDGRQSQAAIPNFGASTMISRVDLRIARSFEGARYFGGSAAGATRLRLPPDPLPLVRCTDRPCRDGAGLPDIVAYATAGDTPFGFNRCARRSVLARRRGHTAEASRRVLTFSGELLAPGSGPSPHRTVQFRSRPPATTRLGGSFKLSGCLRQWRRAYGAGLRALQPAAARRSKLGCDRHSRSALPKCRRRAGDRPCARSNPRPRTTPFASSAAPPAACAP